MTLARLTVSAFALGLICAAGWGCSHSGDPLDRPVTAAEIRSNVTPELASLTQSQGQIDNTHARVVDNTFRQISDDLDRIFWLDTNSLLTPYPNVSIAPH